MTWNVSSGTLNLTIYPYPYLKRFTNRIRHVSEQETIRASLAVTEAAAAAAAAVENDGDGDGDVCQPASEPGGTEGKARPLDARKGRSRQQH